MEQAYSDLYREFLRLQSLCLKQAALLHQLTETLKRQQVASARVLDPGAPVSIPAQCSEEQKHHTAACTHEVARLLPPAGQSKACIPAGGDAPAADVLLGGMDRLQLSTARRGGVRGTEPPRPATLGPLAAHGLSRESAPPSGSADLLQPEEHLRAEFYRAMNDPNTGGNTTTQGRKAPWMFSSFLDSEMLSQGGGLLMSEVALHSQVCEFCQAVFPGNTTTLGEILRHLTTHIT
ncbi:uncharacterized protein zgc:113184 isoform X2 [Megalops cyprinoides]|uniref:uncharacterized protein zgc:113184 isoform X2 n=1 Tax=Megalops cyprinoides TaxID=118141 RepID=UPI001863A1C5|nr:uncharacterized protein zgc:113184 isoform X2 [Megalops cyprinoides]